MLKIILSTAMIVLISGCSKNPDSFSMQCIGDPIQLGSDFVQAGREERRTYVFKNQRLDGFSCNWSQQAIYCTKLQLGDKTELVIKRTYPSIASEIQTNASNKLSMFQGKCEVSLKSI